MLPSTNAFFQLRREDDGYLPEQVIARKIEEVGGRVLFDAVESEWVLRRLSSGEEISASEYHSAVGELRVFAIEIPTSRLRSWDYSFHRGKYRRIYPWMDWVSLTLHPNPDGLAEVYSGVSGSPQRADVHVDYLDHRTRKLLDKMTSLEEHEASVKEIANSLPQQQVEQIFVLDVGQGASNALIDAQGRVMAYVDVGRGVLGNAHTWPAGMKLCFADDPPVILTHWHYDHFAAANHFRAALETTWIAPLQKIGPGPQSAMVASIVKNGRLLLQSGSVRSTHIDIQKCIGSAKNQNRNGLAVWVWGPNASEAPILLPGDAGYSDIPGLPGRVTSLVASHHVGYAPGVPPGPANANFVGTRVAMSYGQGNSHRHPSPKSIAKLQTAGWAIGAPAPLAHDRRTEHRIQPHGFGSIRLRWPSSVAGNRACACGCTIEPLQ